MSGDERTRNQGERLYRTVARRIARLIEANGKSPRWRMPSERELAEELEISRPVVREAIIALEMRGIVEVKGRAAITVLPLRGPCAIPFSAADRGKRVSTVPRAGIAIDIPNGANLSQLPSLRNAAAEWFCKAMFRK